MPNENTPPGGTPTPDEIPQGAQAQSRRGLAPVLPSVPRGRKNPPKEKPAGWQPLPRCQARTKASTPENPIQCPNAAYGGTHACYQHGGKTPSGPAAGSFKHGAYSKVMPNRLLDAYETARTDPNLLDLTDDIATLRAWQVMILRGMSNGEGGDLWTKLQEANTALHTAIRTQDANAMNASLRELTQIIHTGVSDEAALKQFNHLALEKRKLVAEERQRRTLLRALVPVEQVVSILRAYTNVVFRYVKDPVSLANIGRELKEINDQLRSGQAIAA